MSGYEAAVSIRSILSFDLDDVLVPLASIILGISSPARALAGASARG
jgi:hypothetical protein